MAKPKESKDNGALAAAEAKALFYQTQCEGAAAARKRAEATATRLEAELKQATKDRAKLRLHLDATLYSMAAMQADIRNLRDTHPRYIFEENRAEWERVAAGDSLAVAT